MGVGVVVMDVGSGDDGREIVVFMWMLYVFYGVYVCMVVMWIVFIVVGDFYEFFVGCELCDV